MTTKPNITASIVIYNENLETLIKAINSFLESPLAKKLFIIDNSPTDLIRNSINNPKIEYVYQRKNLGFGQGHNSILKNVKLEKSDFHLILNPDVTFDSKTLGELTSELKKDTTLSMISPKVLFPNKDIQYTARKYPKFLEMCYRFFGIFKNVTEENEYRNQDLNTSFYPDFIHGNFMLFKTEDLMKLNGFDKRFFMYMEDVDICKRIDQLGKKKMYYPHVEIFHELRKGSSKKINLFFIHIASVIKYYKKWGL